MRVVQLVANGLHVTPKGAHGLWLGYHSLPPLLLFSQLLISLGFASLLQFIHPAQLCVQVVLVAGRGRGFCAWGGPGWSWLGGNLGCLCSMHSARGHLGCMGGAGVAYDINGPRGCGLQLMQSPGLRHVPLAAWKLDIPGFDKHVCLTQLF